MMSGGLSGRLSNLSGGSGSFVPVAAAAAFAAASAAESACDDVDWLPDKGFDRKYMMANLNSKFTFHARFYSCTYYRLDGQSCCFLVHTSMESCSPFIFPYISR